MDAQSQPRVMELTVGATQWSASGRGPSRYQWIDNWKLFNEGRCSYQICKFRHACIVCRGETLHWQIWIVQLMGDGAADGR